MILIDYRWYGSYYNNIAGCVLQFDTITEKFVAYLGVGNSGNEETDIDLICKYGNKISRNVALTIFGDINYQGIDLKDNYKTN